MTTSGLMVDAPFSAYFSPESPSVFSVVPAAGVLGRVGTDGQMFTISYSPLEYGKVVRGTLIVLTDEMQWSYDVRGAIAGRVRSRGGRFGGGVLVGDDGVARSQWMPCVTTHASRSASGTLPSRQL